jgi:LuxR family maltose regulon positive regulatory protein
MLEWLERANLFLVPLDDAGSWYRYHHLFADALRQRLRSQAPQRLADLHARAAAWFQAAGRDEAAVEHLLASGDWSAAAELMARLGSGLLERGEHATLWRWLARLPADLRRTTPAFSSTYALSLLLDGRIDALQRLLEATEPYLEAQGRARELGNLLSVRATFEVFREDTARAAACTERALALLPDGSVGFHSMALLATARAALLEGETARAEQALGATRRLLEAGYVPVAELHARLVGAALDVQQGRLRRAASTYQNTLALLGGQTGFARNDSALRLASIYFDWLRLDAAAELVEPVLADLERSGRLAAALPYDRLAHLLIVRGVLERAAAVIRTGEAGGQALRSAPRLRRLAAERARLALAGGDTESASTWARARLAELDALRAFPRLDEAIVLVRVLLGTGDTGALAPVAGLLEGLIDDATAHQRLASLAELLGLQALMRLQLGQRGAAEDALDQALHLGEPEELARHIVEGGPSMLALLRQALGRGLAPRYVAGLVQRFAPPVAAQAGGGVTAAPGLLSPREQEVLEVLAEGLSTREIAQRLVVSEHTVKTHLQHLSAKLGAGSRTHLLARAHELGLLEARRAHRPDQPFGGWPAATGGPA